MRIDKPVAMSALSSEIGRLSTQIVLCDAQFAAVLGLDMPSLSGQAAQAFRANVKRYSVVLLTHSYYYHAIRAADQRNLVMVTMLPTTDGLVLDTGVAQARIDAAKNEISRLRAQKEYAVAEANRINAEIDAASKLLSPVTLPFSVKPINVEAIIAYYDALITVQVAIVSYYTLVIDAANKYIDQSLALYQTIDPGALQQSANALFSVANRNVWTPFNWFVNFVRENTGHGVGYAFDQFTDKGLKRIQEEFSSRKFGGNNGGFSGSDGGKFDDGFTGSGGEKISDEPTVDDMGQKIGEQYDVWYDDPWEFGPFHGHLKIRVGKFTCDGGSHFFYGEDGKLHQDPRIAPIIGFPGIDITGDVDLGNGVRYVRNMTVLRAIASANVDFSEDHPGAGVDFGVTAFGEKDGFVFENEDMEGFGYAQYSFGPGGALNITSGENERYGTVCYGTGIEGGYKLKGRE